MLEKRNQKDIFASKIENFSSGDLISASPDLIAVKYGVKRVARLEISSPETFKDAESELKRHSLIAACSDKMLLGKYNLYASRDKKSAIEAKNLDPSFRIINEKNKFGEIVKDVRKFSRLLSYPNCCIEGYISNILKNVFFAESPAFKIIPRKINFLFNNLLNGVSNHYLSFHFPCSFACRKTLDYQKKIFGKIRRFSPLFAGEIETYLRHPCLVFLNPALGNMYASWDNRMGFIFNGRTNGRELFYLRALVFKTNYPDYAGNQKDGREFPPILAWINQGDRLVFRDNGFWILKGQSLLYKFKNSESLFAYFFNFI